MGGAADHPVHRKHDLEIDVVRLDKVWDEAVRRSWTVTNMKTEWKKVFAFEPVKELKLQVPIDAKIVHHE